MLRKSRQKPLDGVFELLREGRMREGAELLYRECYNKVYGIAFSILHDEGKSEDVVHNVVGKIITLKTENAPTDSELRWLYKLTKNTALDYLNAAEPTLSLDEVAPIACEDRSIAEFVDMDAYYSMIKGLDERRKRVVTLKVLGGYTHREIAGITKLPIGTVMWLYNTAIQQLRITLASMLTLILAVGVIFVERLVCFVNEFVISSGAQSPEWLIPYYTNWSTVKQWEYIYHKERVLLLGGLLLLVIALGVVVFIRYVKRSAKGKTRGIDVSVLISAMLISSFITTIAAHTINYNENKPELEIVHYTDMQIGIRRGESCEDLSTPAKNDFKLDVSREYYLSCKVCSYQQQGALDINKNLWFYADVEDLVFLYDEDLVEIRFGENELVAYIIPLQTFDHSSVSIYYEKYDLSVGISISAVNN